jgi:hypothetical protein
MNKLIITIIAITVIAFGIGAFFVLKKPAFPQPQQESVSISTPETWSEPYLNYAYLRRAWEASGREWLHEYSGVKWNPSTRKWELDRQWPYDIGDVGKQAYNIEFTAQGAVNMGLVYQDVGLLNELAEFYTVYLNRFITLGQLRAMESSTHSTYHLINQGDNSARTLPYIEESDIGKFGVREEVIANSKFFYNGQSYSVRDLEGQPQYPIMLFWVLSGTPEKLHGCAANTVSQNPTASISQLTKEKVLNGFDPCGQQFENGEIDNGWGKYIQLEKTYSQAQAGISLSADSIVFADLDSDGLMEALVPARIVRASSGGVLYVFKNDNGVARVIDTIDFGKENGKVISIDKDNVVVQTDGAMGYAPTKQTYKFVDGKLIKQ